MGRPKVATSSPLGPYGVWCVCGLLLLAIAVIYGQTLTFPLLDWDDPTFVKNNRHVNAGLTVDGARWAFTSGPFGEWYPLAMLSHMLDCQIFGLNGMGHHLTSVLIHAATSIALFLVFLRMTEAFWASAFVATVFAVHPEHVETVAWVSERKEVLSGFFFVLTLGAYLGYVRRGFSLWYYLLALVLFALGLMSKPMIVTLPPLLLLLDYWPLGRFGVARDTAEWTKAIGRPNALWLVLEKLPFLALALTDCLITLRTHAGGGIKMEPSVRIGNAIYSGVAYVVQFFCPVDLVPFYPIPEHGQPTWEVAAAGTILVAVSAMAFICYRRWPDFFVGWFWYLGMIFPVLGLLNVGWAAMADRYMHLPSIGLSIALAWGLGRLVASSAEGRLAVGTGAALAIALLILAAVWQTNFWRNDETLWTHALDCTTNNFKAEVGLGDVLAHRGSFDEAERHYRRAIEHAKDYTPFNNLGLTLARQNQLAEATELFRKAVETEPGAFQPHANLGLALMGAGEFEEALQEFHRALEIDPTAVNAYCGLALLLSQMDRAEDARAEFARAFELEPDNPSIHFGFGSFLLEQGDVDSAIPQLEAALSADQKNLAAHINLARAFAMKGRNADAETHFRQALALDPANPVAQRGLAELHQ